MSGRNKFPLIPGESKRDRINRMRRDRLAKRSPEQKSADNASKREYNQAYYSVKGEEMRIQANRASLKYLYNLSDEQRRQMFENQEGLCANCSKPICLCSGSETGHRCKTRACIDHDHSCCTGIKSCGNCVRGLMCHSCNVGLGGFRDLLHLLRNAISYLEIPYELLSVVRSPVGQ